MDEEYVKRICKRMREKSTPELRQIWEEKDTTVWHPEAIEAARRVLSEREAGVETPVEVEVVETPVEVEVVETPVDYVDAELQGVHHKRFPWSTLFVVAVAVAVIYVFAAVVVVVPVHPQQVAATRCDLIFMEKALQIYYQDYGRYPPELASLFKRQKNSKEPYISGEVTAVLKDPWGREYIYRADNDIYEITSYGRDGEPGGEGHDRDITVTNAASEK